MLSFAPNSQPQPATSSTVIRPTMTTVPHMNTSPPNVNNAYNQFASFQAAAAMIRSLQQQGAAPVPAQPAMSLPHGEHPAASPATQPHLHRQHAAQGAVHQAHAQAQQAPNPGHFLLSNEEPKPQYSYIGLIAMAILSSTERKMVLSDIYQWILDNYPYFRTRGPGWRNSIRHNLSLNDCFMKAGRSANGKGHYWAIHPANIEDFIKGDYRRRRAQRKVRKHMGLQVDDDSDSDESPSNSPLFASGFRPAAAAAHLQHMQHTHRWLMLHGGLMGMGAHALPHPGVLGLPSNPMAAALAAATAAQQSQAATANLSTESGSSRMEPRSNPAETSSHADMHGADKSSTPPAVAKCDGGEAAQISPTNSTSSGTASGANLTVSTPTESSPTSSNTNNQNQSSGSAGNAKRTSSFDMQSILSPKRQCISSQSSGDSVAGCVPLNTLASGQNKTPVPDGRGLFMQAVAAGLWQQFSGGNGGSTPWAQALLAASNNSAHSSTGSQMPKLGQSLQKELGEQRIFEGHNNSANLVDDSSPTDLSQKGCKLVKKETVKEVDTAAQWQETFAKIMARSYQARQQRANQGGNVQKVESK